MNHLCWLLYSLLNQWFHYPIGLFLEFELLKPTEVAKEQFIDAIKTLLTQVFIVVQFNQANKAFLYHSYYENWHFVR